MNKTARFLSIAAVAAFASFGAQADEADGSQFALQFDTNRTRAEVVAEAAAAVQMRSQEPAGSRGDLQVHGRPRCSACRSCRTSHAHWPRGPR